MSETLAVYGFSLDYPTGCVLEFNPRFTREAGDLAVKHPDGKWKVFVSWGPLDRVRKATPTPEAHAAFALERVRKTSGGRVSDTRKSERTVLGHLCSVTTATVELRKGLLGRPERQEMTSVHLHCADSGRYFVIYGSAVNEASGGLNEAIETMVSSFVCH